MANIKKISSRRRLFDLFKEIDGAVAEVGEILRSEHPSDYSDGRAYWLASLSVGLRSDEYFTHNPTMQSYLLEQGIVDEDGNYIEEDGSIRFKD